MLQAVIMAGGSGTRFWPASRHDVPKQFLHLFGERSLLQQTVDRLDGLIDRSGILLVTNHRQAAKSAEQLPELVGDQIIAEPCGRDTAPCIGLAAALLVRRDPLATMLVLAADHLIKPVTMFQDAIRAAARFVEENPAALLTFGIPPTYPATGYGYLQSDSVVEANEVTFCRLASFHEKPDAATAARFVAGGKHFWNSGMFCWKAKAILAELARFEPAIHDAVERIADSWQTADRLGVFQREFESIKRISIDFAVMERAKEVYMIQAPFQWDDVGSWLALERVLPHDASNNVVIGKHEGIRTNRCVVVSGHDHLVATIGVEDLIVVHTADVTLVADRRDEQQVKSLLDVLRQKGLGEYL